MPAKTALSEEISAVLKKRGFKFVGPVIVYAWMQASGMVNDHDPRCFRAQPVSPIIVWTSICGDLRTSRLKRGALDQLLSAGQVSDPKLLSSRSKCGTRLLLTLRKYSPLLPPDLRTRTISRMAMDLSIALHMS